MGNNLSKSIIIRIFVTLKRRIYFSNKYENPKRYNEFSGRQYSHFVGSYG